MTLNPKSVEAARAEYFAPNADQSSKLERAIAAYLAASQPQDGLVERLTDQAIYLERAYGWTGDIEEAAARITSLSAEVERVTQSNAALMAERVSLIETKREQIERLKDEREAWVGRAQSLREEINAQAIDFRSAEARLAAAVEALKPFADFPGEDVFWDKDCPDDYVWVIHDGCMLTVGPFRAARATIDQEGGE